jgi:hypothetical protein
VAPVSNPKLAKAWTKSESQQLGRFLLPLVNQENKDDGRPGLTSSKPPKRRRQLPLAEQPIHQIGSENIGPFLLPLFTERMSKVNGLHRKMMSATEFLPLPSRTRNSNLECGAIHKGAQNSKPRRKAQVNRKISSPSISSHREIPW